MNKYLILFLLLIIAIGGFILFSQSAKRQDSLPPQIVQTTSPSPATEKENVDHKASFVIFTNGTIRIFDDPKYHNRSSDVFIDSTNPRIIHIKVYGIKWSDFFNSLPSPMKVTKTCLTTGTNQVLCNTNTHSLKFYLNGQLEANLLNLEIKDRDELLVSYGAKNDKNINNQLEDIPEVN